MDETDLLIKMVNQNSDLVQIAEYIMSEFPNVFEFAEAKKLAENLIGKEYTKEDILNGFANRYISKIIMLKRITESNVQKENEPKSKIEFRIIKKSIDKKFVAAALLATLVISSVAYIGHGFDKENEDVVISEYLGMLASPIGSDDYIHKRNIVNQNSYGLGYGDSRVVAYDNYKIAQDIIDVCVKDPSLMDLCIYRTYFDMKYNRLENMDEVLRCLKMFTKDDESLNFVATNLEGFDTFLEYMLDYIKIDKDSKEYSEFVEVINAYKNAKGESGSAFNALDSKEKKIIEKLVNYYQNCKNTLYSEHKATLENLVNGNTTPNEAPSEGGRK